MSIQVTGNVVLSRAAGSSALGLEDLRDVNIVDPQNNDFLKYNSATQEWINDDLLSALTSSDGVTLELVSGLTNIGLGDITPTSVNTTGTVTANSFVGTVTGASSLNVLKAGDTMTGNLTTTAGTMIIVGTDIPVPASTSLPALQITGKTTGGSSLGVQIFSNDTSGPVTYSLKSRGTNIGEHVAVASGDNLGGTVFEGSDGTSFIRAAAISAAVDGTVSTGIVPGRLYFTTRSPTGVQTERMRIDSNGNVGIGGTPNVGQTLRVGKNMTGAVNTYGVISNGALQSDATGVSHSFYSSATTAAATFTASILSHFSAVGATKGAGSTLNTQYGFLAESTLTTATNNYGFIGNLAAATGRWNLYMNGNAQNYFAGNVGIGTGKGVPAEALDITGNIKASGTVTATTFIGAVTGNASTATSAATLTTTRTFSATGDATAVAQNFNGSADVVLPMLLATVNLAPQTDTFRKVTVNGKGLVTATTAVLPADITTALAYTPVNTAGDTMTGPLLLNADPTQALGAVTKQYVDNVAAGLAAHPSSITATTATLAVSSAGTVTYANGTAGVGATLTTTGTFNNIGGVTTVNGNRILVKNEATAANNGIYVRTSATVLTRATDFDNSPTGEIDSGAFTFISTGTLAGTNWVLTTPAPIVVGTTGLVFTQLSGAGQYTAGTGISIASNVISNTGVLSVVGTSNQITTSTVAGATTLSLPSTVILSATGSGSSFMASSDAGQQASLYLRTGSVLRWRIGKNTSLESGSNLGSDLAIDRYDDTGNYIDSPLAIRRDTGTVTVSKPGTGNTQAFLNIAADIGSLALGANSSGYTPTTTYGDPSESFIRGGANTAGIYINSAKAASYIRFAIANSEQMRVDSGGRLLVGSTAPEVVASGTANITSKLQVLGTTQNTSSIAAVRYFNDTSPGMITIGKSRGTTTSSQGLVLTNDNLGIYSWNGSDGVQMREAARIQTIVSSAAAGYVSGTMLLSTTPVGATDTIVRLLIGADGGLVIGTGTASIAGQSVRLVKGITGAVTSSGFYNTGQVQSDVTTSAIAYNSAVTTSAATFTLGTLSHFYANPSALGAGSTITNHIGFAASANITSGTANYGFWSGITAGSGRWNFYAGADANNYFAGNLGIGAGKTVPAQALDVNGNILASGTITATTFIGAVTGASSLNVLKAGDTMTGPLRLTQPTNTAQLILDSDATNSSEVTFQRVGVYKTALAQVGANNNYINGSAPGDFVFQNTGGRFLWSASGANAQMTLDATGNVGIGINPTARLDVSTSAQTIARLASTSTGGGFLTIGNAGSASRLILGTGTNVLAGMTAADSGIVSEQGALMLGSNNLERMRIAPSGNVLIGTTADSSSVRLAVYAPDDARLVLNGTNNSTSAGGAVLFYRTSTLTGRIGTSANAIGDSSNNLHVHSINDQLFTTGTGSGTERMRIVSDGKVLIGATAQFINGAILQVQTPTNNYPLALRCGLATAGSFWLIGPDSNNTCVVYNHANIGMYMTSGGTAWTANSDERNKTDFIEFTDAVTKVATLRAGTGRYLQDEIGTKRSFLIAQDVQAVLPGAVSPVPKEHEDDPDRLGLAYTDVIPLLVAAIKELKAEIELLKSQIA